MTTDQLVRDLAAALRLKPASVTLPPPTTPVQQALYGRATEIMIQYLEACETRNQHHLEHIESVAHQLVETAETFHTITEQLNTVIENLSQLVVNRELEREVLELLKAQVT
jgi:hypothetical protein